jgi:hypothetical protein
MVRSGRRWCTLSIHWPGRAARTARAQSLRLEPAHLAGRSHRPGDRSIADHPAHRWVAAQPLGVIHVLVASQPPEHRLAQQADQVAAVLACTRVGQRIGTRVGQTQVSYPARGRPAVRRPASEVIAERHLLHPTTIAGVGKIAA